MESESANEGGGGRRRRGRIAAVGAVVVAALALGGVVIARSRGADLDVAQTAADASSGHSAHDDQMSTIDARRCDRGFNPKAYWSEAAAMGVDTYEGGTMSMASDAGGAGDGSTPGPSDELVAATERAATGGEVDASLLVDHLGRVSDADYDAWRSYVRAQSATHGGTAHSHDPADSNDTPDSPAVAPDDNGGHGGHLGPQPWVAMVDPEQCVQLAQELAEARTVALSMPTAADAIAAGYVKITPYLPGIAAHYMKYSEVDGEFHVDRPEMVLYDGNGTDAHVVGLSYYIVQPGNDEPTQGFVGDDDHYHRHVGLCTKTGAGVIGDSTTSESACRAMGGVKSSGGAGWMSHAWVVPGCESPWGVFSGENPVLDGPLATRSGTGEGGCSGSDSRRRYDLQPGAREVPGRDERTSGG